MKLIRVPPFLLLVVLPFIAVILFVNPLRETAVADDWSYAEVVKTLMQTGQYVTHDWPISNMPAQAYWGALFTNLFGFTFISLRISTLVLFFLALIAFYYLAKEHELGDFPAALLTLIFFASPQILSLSFSFMTDVPALSFLVISAYFYTRALKTQNYRGMLTGSIISAAAILTRLIGIATLIGMLGVVALSFAIPLIRASERRLNWRLILTGIVIPLLAIGWRSYAENTSPNWASLFFERYQDHYLAALAQSPFEWMLQSVFWRFTVAFQYLALFTAPLIPLAAIEAFNRVKTAPHKHMALLGGIISIFIVGLLLSIPYSGGLWMPYIGTSLIELGKAPLLIRAGFTFVTFCGAVFFAYLCVLNVSKPFTPIVRLVDVTALVLLASVIFPFLFVDRYLLGTVPFFLLIVGRLLRFEQKWLKRVTIAAVLGFLVISAFVARKNLVLAEVLWRGGDMLAAMGVPEEQIGTNWTWKAYHGSFRRYLADEKAWIEPDGFYYMQYWRIEQYDLTTYRVVTQREDYPDWDVIATLPYEDLLLRPRVAYVIKKPQ